MLKIAADPIQVSYHDVAVLSGLGVKSFPELKSYGHFWYHLKKYHFPENSQTTKNTVLFYEQP